MRYHLYFERAGDLMPGMAILRMDIELRMKGRIVPMVEEELKKSYQDLGSGNARARKCL
jgi:hypothetical protein